MLETVISSVLSFIGTNIDDIFILTLFFAQTDTRPKVWSVTTGQYLGLGALVLLSWLATYGLQILPQSYISLLGLVPIALGIRAWSSCQTDRHTNEGSPAEAIPSTIHPLSVALVTMSNGGDNIGVYIPLFVGYSLPQMAVVVVVFILMTALWCFLGKQLSDLPALRAFLQKYKHIIVPVVFLALGIYILAKGFS